MRQAYTLQESPIGMSTCRRHGLKAPTNTKTRRRQKPKSLCWMAGTRLQYITIELRPTYLRKGDELQPVKKPDDIGIEAKAFQVRGPWRLNQRLLL